jgi:hypothetical protein
MRRRGLIQLHSDKTDSLTSKGQAELDAWLSSRNQSLDHFKALKPVEQPLGSRPARRKLKAAKAPSGKRGNQK